MLEKSSVETRQQREKMSLRTGKTALVKEWERIMSRTLGAYTRVFRENISGLMNEKRKETDAHILCILRLPQSRDCSGVRLQFLTVPLLRSPCRLLLDLDETTRSEEVRGKKSRNRDTERKSESIRVRNETFVIVAITAREVRRSPHHAHGWYHHTGVVQRLNLSCRRSARF